MEVSTRQNTKADLLRSAERLIAERGIGAVSVKMITTDAGARNPSAVHYHFGSIEGLIREVFAQRYRAIEAERAVRLQKIDESDPHARLVALIEAAIGPFMEACLKESGRMYVSFALQFGTDPRFDLSQSTLETSMQSLVWLRDELVSCLPHIPLDKLVSRMRHSFMISLVQAADYAGQVEAGTAPPVEDAVKDAASCIAAYLGA